MLLITGAYAPIDYAIQITGALDYDYFVAPLGTVRQSTDTGVPFDGFNAPVDYDGDAQLGIRMDYTPSCVTVCFAIITGCIACGTGCRLILPWVCMHPMQL